MDFIWKDMMYHSEPDCFLQSCGRTNHQRQAAGSGIISSDYDETFALQSIFKKLVKEINHVTKNK